jgi:hypothetical protein
VNLLHNVQSLIALIIRNATNKNLISTKNHLQQYGHNNHNHIERLMLMGRRRKSRTLSAFEKHPIGAPLVLLITIGVVLADHYNNEQPKFNTLEIIALLVTSPALR